LRGILRSKEGTELRVFLYWSAWIAIAFFSVYPVTNWLASQRAHTFALYIPLELEMPFVPQFIWVYLSLYVLFLAPAVLMPAARMPSLGKQLVAGTLISGLIFVLVPARLGFPRIVPQDALHGGIYATVFEIDQPHNLVPSLHLVFSGAIALACAHGASPALRRLLFAWLAAITLSTVLVRQHHLLDVAAAFVLVYFLRQIYKVNNA
jgi:membrane-associated phospholipid phosphatase